MREELEKTLKRYEELGRQLEDPEVLANSARLAPIARAWLVVQIGQQVSAVQIAESANCRSQ